MMRHLWCGILLVTLWLAGTAAGTHTACAQEKTEPNARAASPPEVVSEVLGIRFTKPDRLWTVLNEEDSSLPKLVCLAEESDTWSPRFAVLALPSIIMPNGMEARLRQVKISYADNRRLAQSQDTADIAASQLRILKFEKTTFAGRDAMLFVYEISGEKNYRTVEYGFSYQNNFYIVQAAAPTELWEKPEGAAMFDRSFKSFSFLKSSSRK
ncbi:MULTISPECIES: hypothetical protein [Chloracidobacterium]|uniref:PsbP C-terminal domain-containing protein n=1 Tax=Chloracidobacterium thermophilum (strain B) TaxID=981222 RepID=G2LHG4_CHLTF|nr:MULTISPECIES: hypothetical protein [Chloracidobacterium]AEP12227.1 hypothetical protein Cabther_A1477 [Chloracidobacterium thermophilum B]QUV77964.1 hypothetical protein J8C08_07505 [Chloracidobacterium thermophilum]QUV81020.1 hypothetical protein J8C01_07170 [Chloracidobacterium sp. D]